MWRPASLSHTMYADTARLPADLLLCLSCHEQTQPAALTLVTSRWAQRSLPSKAEANKARVSFLAVIRDTRNSCYKPPAWPPFRFRLCALICWTCMNRLQRPRGKRSTAVLRMTQRLMLPGSCYAFDELSRVLPQHFDILDSTLVAALNCRCLQTTSGSPDLSPWSHRGILVDVL